MIAIQNINSTKPSNHLRQLDARRDLQQVADLIEQCFADTLDSDGRNYINQMRNAARNPFLGWAESASQGISMPMTGYVWEEDTQVVGNLSLIPFYRGDQRIYLIANVAVHPYYRRRGIAQSLTTKAIEFARLRGANCAWLQVREDNEAALHLYHSSGFVERARRTTWLYHPLQQKPLSSSNEQYRASVTIGKRKPEDWQLQLSWLRDVNPESLNWHLSLNVSNLQPGVWGFIRRFMSDAHVRHWAARDDRGLMGVLTWVAAYASHDNLWLAADPGVEEDAAQILLSSIGRKISFRRPLALDYPAEKIVRPLTDSGFKKHQTLIWMSLPLNL